MLTELSLGVNAVRQISDTRGMTSVNIIKIADYLNCSVDYLLGRTENSESVADSSKNVTAKNVLQVYNNHQSHFEHNQVNFGLPEKTTELCHELIQLLSELPFRDQTELMSMIYQYVDKYKEKNNDSGSE